MAAYKAPADWADELAKTIALDLGAVFARGLARRNADFLFQHHGPDVEPGFQTPGRHFGPDFVLSVAGVVREDLA